ncbi:TolC family protein [Proteiniphilum acetatigenes]|uniref:TolC family protein n=1 Tax=Proteiniphilum acetatigenes TaxID=294710 RepID=UPI0003653719|nr:TolC family protein [Proteiniphilum acetatigenes]SFL24148.1 Outer membrane protein TolC [Porphyromonadaceae bacterium KH3CP3RA]
MMINKLLLSLSGWLIVAGCIQAQSISLEECYQWAESNYPLVKQYALIEKTQSYSIANASRGSLPQLQIGGQASYQSDVTQIPLSLPNVDIPVMSKDQYKLYGEISQPITDLLTVKRQKELIDANARVEEQKIEVELYKLKERINQLYFGILLMDEQIAQVRILQKDLQSGINKNSVAIANGIVLKSSADMLRAELLKTEQRVIELKAVRKGYADVLALFIDRDISENTILERPSAVTSLSGINRPELQLFEMQKQTFEVQNKLVDTQILPRFSLFLQGGYGRPALNMLNNDFDLYYIGGVRFAWNISGFYTHKREKRLLVLSQNAVDVQKELFLFNTNLTLKQQNNEIIKLEELIEADKEIIRLRENVKLAAQSQLEHGTVTANDYLTYVNAEDQARQNLILHEMELLMAQYKLKTTAGSFFLIDN